MKTPRKQRVDKDGRKGVLQRLRELPEAVQEELFLRAQEVSAKTLIAEIRARHSIEGLSEQRLSDFWRWLDGRRKLRQMQEDAEQFRAAFALEGVAASPEDIHIRTVDYLRMKGLREDDEKTLKFAVGEARRAIELERERERFQFDAAKAALACLPALRRIQADKALDDKSRVTAARKVLFGVTPE